jgi:hypothetical protein
MAQEEHFEEILDAEKLWTAEGSDRSRYEDTRCAGHGPKGQNKDDAE